MPIKLLYSLFTLLLSASFVNAIPNPNESKLTNDQSRKASTDDALKAFLKKHGIRKITYPEALTLLGVTNLFGTYDSNDDNAEHEDSYESQYADPTSAIYFADHDLTFQEDFQFPEGANPLLIVKGNLTVNGWMKNPYYVTGDVNVEGLEMSNDQICKGKESVKYIQYQHWEDDEITASSRNRTITAPYFFSWYFSYDNHKYAPETVVITIGEESDVDLDNLQNPHFVGQEYCFAFKNELVGNLSYRDDNMYYYDLDKIFTLLKNGKSIYNDGFQLASFKYYMQGKALLREKEYEHAFYNFKKVIELSPNFYLGYLWAGNALRENNAYSQAISYYENGIKVLPSHITYPEFECADMGSFCALRTGNNEKAMNFANISLKRNEKNHIGLSRKAEALIYTGKTQEAITYLEKAIELDDRNRRLELNQWLLGLAYFKEGNNSKAKLLYDKCIEDATNGTYKYYTEAQSLNHLYDEPTTVAWEKLSLATTPTLVKDQIYWDKYFLKKTGEKDEKYFVEHQVVATIPMEFRTQAMLVKLLTYENIDSRIIEAFPKGLITKEIAIKAFHNKYPCNTKSIPKEFLDYDMYYGNQGYIALAEMPKEYLDYKMCYKKVRQNSRQYFEVPKEFQDEKMAIACISSGGLYIDNGNKLPKKYSDIPYILKAVDLGIETLENLPVKLVEKEVYDYAEKKYGKAEKWQELLKDHSPLRELDYDTFSKVWAYFWSEAFIIKAITIEGEGERIYGLPKKYITQKIANVAVRKYSYDFVFVPKEFITQEMCEIACGKDYGSAIEFVPLAMRTQKVCELAIRQGFDNLRFVPLQYRTKDLCMKALINDTRQLEGVPYELYVPIFENLINMKGDRFDKGYKYLNLGKGYFFEKKFDLALTQFQKVQQLEKEEEEPNDERIQKSIYMEGWAYFKQGNFEKAKERFETSQLKEVENKYDKPYEIAVLEPVMVSVWDFNRGEFDHLMEEIQQNMSVKNFENVEEPLKKAEEMLTKASCSDNMLWAYVWDFQRYFLYETGRKEECYQVCKNALPKLSAETLWPYLKEHTPIRHAIRAMNNSLANRAIEVAKNIDDIKQGLEHNKLSFTTFSPIEEEKVLYEFYETKALLLEKAMSFDSNYKNLFEEVMLKIKDLKLKEKDVLSKDFIERHGL